MFGDWRPRRTSALQPKILHYARFCAQNARKTIARNILESVANLFLCIICRLSQRLSNNARSCGFLGHFRGTPRRTRKSLSRIGETRVLVVAVSTVHEGKQQELASSQALFRNPSRSTFGAPLFRPVSQSGDVPNSTRNPVGLVSVPSAQENYRTETYFLYLFNFMLQ